MKQCAQVQEGIHCSRGSPNSEDNLNHLNTPVPMLERIPDPAAQSWEGLVQRLDFENEAQAMDIGDDEE